MRKMLWTRDSARIASTKAISHRLGRTLQDFFATENTAYGDDVKAGVRIDPDKLAHHMIVRSGLADHQINHIYGFVHDAEMATLNTRKTQEPALRFLQQALGRGPTPISQCVSGPILTTNDGTCPCGSIGSLAKTSDVDSTSDQCHQKQRRARALGDQDNSPTENGREHNDWCDPSSA